MSWGVSTASVIAAGAAVISGSVTAYAWRHRQQWTALSLVALTATLATWSLLYGIQLGFGTLAGQLPWQRVTLGVAGIVPTVWLLFVLAYTGREAWLDPTKVALFLTEPLAFLLVCLSNPSHGLVWTDATMTGTVVGDVVALEFGVAYVLHIAYAYVVVAGGVALLVLYGVQVAPTYQKQVQLLASGAVPALLCHVAFTLGVSPIPNLDLTPFAFAFTGLVIGLALFRFDLLELAPIARTQSLEEVGDGLVVVNENDEIVDVFGTATEVLDPTPRVGDPISEVFPDAEREHLDGSEMQTNLDGQRRVYQFQVSSLTDDRDRPVGTIIILRDVTGLRESRQRLGVSNRVLRHNLRNDMNVVLGYARQLEDRLHGRDAEDARRIRDTVESVLDLTEKARKISELETVGGDGGTTIEVVEHLRGVLEDLRSEHPEADFRMETTREVHVDGVDPEPFRLAVRNVLDNAVRHNDTATPRVAVEVDRTEAGTLIEISDDGPGIPDSERAALESDVETSLQHSTGLGLWLTYWCVATWGGDLRFDAGPEGTTVTITVPGERSTANAGSSIDGPAS